MVSLYFARAHDMGFYGVSEIRSKTGCLLIDKREVVKLGWKNWGLLMIVEDVLV